MAAEFPKKEVLQHLIIAHLQANANQAAKHYRMGTIDKPPPSIYHTIRTFWRDHDMKTILLTGAGGFVGARIAHHMKDRYQLITFPKGMLAGADPEAVYAFAMEHKPHAIIHTAAISDIGECEKDPEASWRANVLLTVSLCRAAHELDVKAVCYSSDQVYTGCRPEDGPYREDIPLSPTNVYARHKLEAEQRGLSVCPDAVMLRATWMYDLPGDGLPIRSNLMMNLLEQAKENRVERFSTTDLRGITYVRQVAKWTEQALQLPGGAYNFGSPNDRNMVETARAALKALGLPETLAAADDSRPARCLAMDPSKLNACGLAFDSTQEGFLRCVRQAVTYCKAVENGI